MKKFTLYIALLLLFVNNGYSQSSCATAFPDGFLDTIPFPVVGTMAPVGPDYGTLDILSRPVWGVISSCDSLVWINVQFDVNQTNSNAYCSIIIYGPFYSKSDACNNLSASNIFLVRDSVQHNGSSFNMYNIYANAGEIYVYMLTTDDMTPNNDYYSYLSYSIQLLGGTFEPCFLCNDKVTQMIHRNICMITFDTSSQKTKLIWEKQPDNNVGGYLIYRSASQGALMDSIGFVPEILPSEYIDYDSHPLQYAEYYKVVPVDSCGNRYSINLYYRSTAGFLQTYPSGNNTVNLNWNTFGTLDAYTYYEPVLYIHRGTSAQNMQIIDTIPVGVLNYTDISAPPGQQYYAIERRRFSPCDPLRLSTSSTPYTSSMTNPSVATVTGIPVISDEDLIEINPIPVIDMLTVSVNNSLIGSKLTLVDISGKIQQTILIQNTIETIDVSDLAAGTYWICITGKNKIVKKIIVGK